MDVYSLHEPDLRKISSNVRDGCKGGRWGGALMPRARPAGERAFGAGALAVRHREIDSTPEPRMYLDAYSAGRVLGYRRAAHVEHARLRAAPATAFECGCARFVGARIIDRSSPRPVGCPVSDGAPFIRVLRRGRRREKQQHRHGKSDVRHGIASDDAIQRDFKLT